jgi:hypothetical protein
MIMSDEPDEMDDPEASYRRGYAQGAWDVMEAVLPFLPEAQREKLKGWHSVRVFEWRYRNKQGRASNGRVTGAIMPPRQFLKLRRQSN